MGGVAVHTVSATGCDDAYFRHALARIKLVAVMLNVLHRVADLHWAGVGSQQVTAFDVEGVVHGTGWVVFGRIERGEVEPVGFDLRALGHFKTHGAKNLLHAFERE